jgi:prepilin peptidase CpaA
MPASQIGMALLAAIVWSAACWDLRTKRIPNALVLLALVTGLAVQTAIAGVSGFFAALAGLFVGFTILLPGYLAGATGAGDVKLMAAVGSFLGAPDAFFAGVASLIVGALIALGFVFATLVVPGLESPLRRYALMLRTMFATGRPVYLAPGKGELMGRRFPFAVSIALGTTAVLLLQGSLAGTGN